MESCADSVRVPFRPNPGIPRHTSKGLPGSGRIIQDNKKSTGVEPLLIVCEVKPGSDELQRIICFLYQKSHMGIDRLTVKTEALSSNFLSVTYSHRSKLSMKTVHR